MCTGTPDVSASVAAVWRNVCSVPAGMPAASRCRPNHVGQPLGPERGAELVAEHEVVVSVGVRGEVALEQLRLAVGAQRVDGFGVKRDGAPRACRLGRPERDAPARGDQLPVD